VRGPAVAAESSVGTREVDATSPHSAAIHDQSIASA
jgi:hypothetical protein